MQKRLPNHLQAGLSAQAGWTFAELLIVIAIIGIVALIVLFMNWRRQIDRSYDTRRKSNLNEIRTALEDYYNDKGCYPPAGSFDNCGSKDLYPYLARIPCDPQTQKPFLYIVDPQNPCGGYRMCTTLKDLSDPDIAKLGCDPITGCGWGAGYNYCISVGVQVTAPGFVPSVPTSAPTPTPCPDFFQGTFACTPAGQCNIYADPRASGCPLSYANPTCNNECGDPTKRCAH